MQLWNWLETICVVNLYTSELYIREISIYRPFIERWGVVHINRILSPEFYRELTTNQVFLFWPAFYLEGILGMQFDFRHQINLHSVFKSRKKQSSLL